MDPYYSELYLKYKFFLKNISYLKKIRLNEIQEQVIYFFALHPNSSAYDITVDKLTSSSNGADKGINTKNYRYAKIIVNKLYKLNLIDKNKDKENSHNRYSHSLTDVGLLYIIRSHIFLYINIQTLIKSYGHSKIFYEPLSPFIELETLISINIPRDMSNYLSLYIQEYYSKIEKFISNTENKKDWNENPWAWNIEKIRNYLIEKYKYKWLENAETKENHDQTILQFVNEDDHREYIEIRYEEKSNLGTLIIGTKKRKQERIINIESFLIKFHFSKEESIGRAFSTLDTQWSSKFIFPILSSLDGLNKHKLLFLSKDKKFNRSLETAKKDFDRIYLSIKNPHKYSMESLLAKNFLEIFLSRNNDDK